MDPDGHILSAKMTNFLGWEEGGRPDEDDPAETFHEASKNVPGVLPPVSAMARDLALEPGVGVAEATIRRPVRRNLALPVIELPPPEYPQIALGDAIRRRRSRRHFGPGPLSARDVATLLHAAYGVTGEVELPVGTQRLRSVPSGGGLYPLEIYPLVQNVDGVPAGLYHYDPFRHVLEQIRAGDVGQALAETIIELPAYPDVASSCAVVFWVAGVFWRTRFKYALRGYRWVMLEAGHVGQNVVLAAESLGLGVFPNGGFWDRKVDEYLGLDGVNESVVYSLIAGAPAEAQPEPPGEPSSFS